MDEVVPHDNLEALRERLVTRVDEALTVLLEARRELAELPPPGVIKPWTILTPREAEILELLSQGRSTIQIAKALVIARATVTNHIQQIFKKTGTHSRLEAVAEMGKD